MTKDIKLYDIFVFLLLLAISGSAIILDDSAEYLAALNTCFMLYALLFLRFLFTKQKYKGWFLMSLFIILYSFPFYFDMLISRSNTVHLTQAFGNIMYNPLYNAIGLEVILVYLAGLYASYFLYNNFKKNRNHDADIGRLEDDFKFLMSRSANKMTFLLLAVFILLLLSFKNIDFSMVKEQYAVGDMGFSILMGIGYILNFLFIIMYIKMRVNKKEKKYLAVILILLSYISILSYLGIRQVIFWFIVSILLITFYYKEVLYGEKVNKKVLLSSLFIVLCAIFFGLIGAFRKTKTLDFIFELSFSDFINIVWMAVRWETDLTLYNLFGVIDLMRTHSIDLFPLRQLADFFYLLIPSFIFSDKSNYLIMQKLPEISEGLTGVTITRGGTYFIIGELLLGLKYKLLIFLFGFLIGIAGEVFYNTMRKRNFMFMIFYFFAITYLYAYSIRGLMVGGLKMALFYGVVIYVFMNYRFIFNDNTTLIKRTI